MKKILVSLLILVLCAPAMAATVDIADNYDGTAAITVTAEGSANIVGLALDIEVAGLGNVTAAVVSTATFNIFPDAAYILETDEISPGVPDDSTNYAYGDGTCIAQIDAAGEVGISNYFCVSVGALNGESTAGATGSASVEIVVTVDGYTTIWVSENALRGGIILADGTGEDITNGVGGVVTSDIGGHSHNGDFNEDGFIDARDLSALVYYLTPYAPGYSVSPVPAGDEKYDMNCDNIINALDLSALVAFLTPYAPGYATTNLGPTCWP